VPPTRSLHPPLANLFQVTRDAKVQVNRIPRQESDSNQIREMRTYMFHKQKPIYSKEAVQKSIESSNRSGNKISKKESKLIHALLKGRHES